MRFKSVLGAFLFIVLASFIAFVVFIQTKSFGGLVTKVVSDLSRRKAQTDVRIKNFTISVFPPGLELNRVRVKKKISDVENFEAELGKIGFYISLIEVEEKKLTFGQIRVADSSIKYTFPKKDEELKEIDKAIIDKIFELSEKAPVRVDTLLIENSLIFANHDLLEARRLKVFKRGDSFTARFHVANIKPSPEVDFTLDEVWGDAEVNRNDVNIYRLKVQHDVQTLLLKGKVKNYRLLKNSEVALNGEAQLHLKSFDRDFELPEFIDVKNGFAKIGFNIQYLNKELSAKSDMVLTDLQSNLFHADELRAGVEFEDNKITVTKVDLNNKKEKLKLLAPVQVADINRKTWLTKPVSAYVENVSLNNVLRFLGPSLKVLKGNLTGQLVFEKRGNDFFFTPKDNFHVQNLGLVVGESKDPFTILMAKSVRLQKSEFGIVNNEFQMSTTAVLPRSKLEIDGFVNKHRVKFFVPDSQINLEDLGNISNLDIKGAGHLSVDVSGPLDNVVINIKGKTKGFEILGYRLDETDKNLSIELKEDQVLINKMESKIGKTHVSGTGLVNWGNRDIALGISSNDATSTDLLEILHPILAKVDFLPNDLDFKGKVDVNIFGKYLLPELKIKSKVDFTELIAYGETIPSGRFDVSLLNEVLAFSNFEGAKGQGRIDGDFSFNLSNKIMKMKYRWDNLQLGSFNAVKNLGLNLDSKVSGKFEGSGTPSHYHLKLDSKLFDTRSQNYTFEDSDISMDIYSDHIEGDIKLFGDIVKSDFDLAMVDNRKSKLNLKLLNSDIKPLAVGIFGEHLESEDITGRVNLEVASSFDKGFNNLNLTGTLKQLVFNHPDFNVNYQSKRPEFVVRNSEIEAWNLNIRESDLFLVTKGEGTFGRNVSLIHEFHLNSKLLEILIAPVLSSEGFIRNIVRVEGRKNKYDFSVSSKASDISVSVEQLPFPINHLKYDIEYAGKRLLIQDMITTLDSGTLALKGDVFFDENDPDINLKYQFDRAEIPILSKSVINISGEGIILGNNPPYTIGGEILINKAQIVNELNDFSSKSASFSQIRFLPRNQESAVGKMFALNVNVKAENPVRVTNSLMDVALRGEIQLTGNPSRPRGDGRLFTPVNSSRIFFKNNEYLITAADINFSPKKEISNPDFDVQALTLISNYKVFPKAYGDLERFNFDLTSDPPLPRNSILSLIAFGYTEESQSNLQQKDQQNLTQVGVGSFVFDRFKISDILNKQFGLQVNLGTVIEQSGTDSLLTGRSQEGQFGQGGGALGRTRSATKIELKKRLDEALTLSVSSTMGGSIGQRQSMNLNYGLTKKVQLEGVYELRTNAEGEEDIIDNSIGADVKFRWTFK